MGNKKDGFEIFLLISPLDSIASFPLFHGPKHKKEAFLPEQDSRY